MRTPQTIPYHVPSFDLNPQIYTDCPSLQHSINLPIQPGSHPSIHLLEFVHLAGFIMPFLAQSRYHVIDEIADICF